MAPPITDDMVERVARAAYCDTYTHYGTCTPERWKQTSETQREFFRSMSKAILLILATMGVLSACAADKLPPLPTPGPDMCLVYSSYTYRREAAIVERQENLMKHVANEAIYKRNCLKETPK